MPRHTTAIIFHPVNGLKPKPICVKHCAITHSCRHAYPITGRDREKHKKMLWQAVTYQKRKRREDA